MSAVSYGNFTTADFQKIQLMRKDPKPQWKRIIHRDGQTFEDVKSSKPISDEFEAWLIVLSDGIKSAIITTINAISADTEAWLKKNAVQIKNNIQFNRQKVIEEVERTSLLTEYDALYSTLTPIENDRIPEVDDLFRYLMYSQEQKQEKRRNVRWHLDTYNLDTERLKKLRGTREQHNAQIRTWALVIKEYMGSGGSMGGGLLGKFNSFNKKASSGGFGGLFGGGGGGLFGSMGSLFGGLNLGDVGTMAGYAMGGPVGGMIGGQLGGMVGGEKPSALGSGLGAAFGDPSSLLGTSALTGAFGDSGFGNILGGSMLSGGMGGMLSGGGLGGLTDGLISKDTLGNIGQVASIAGSFMPGPWGAALSAGGALMQGGSMSDAIGAGVGGFTGGGATGAMGMLSGGGGGWQGMAGSAISGFAGGGIGGAVGSVMGNQGGMTGLVGSALSGAAGGGGMAGALSGVFGGGGEANAFNSLLSGSNASSGILSGSGISKGITEMVGNKAGFSGGLASSILGGGSAGSAGSLIGAFGDPNFGELNTGALVGNLLSSNVSNNYKGLGDMGSILSATSKGVGGPLGKAISVGGKVLQGKAVSSNELGGLAAMTNTPVGKLAGKVISSGNVKGDGGFAGLGEGITSAILGETVGRFLGGGSGASLGKSIASSLTSNQVGSAIFNNFGNQVHQLVPAPARKYVTQNVVKAGLSGDKQKLKSTAKRYSSNLKDTYVNKATKTITNTTNAAVNKGFNSLTQRQINEIPKAEIPKGTLVGKAVPLKGTLVAKPAPKNINTLLTSLG